MLEKALKYLVGLKDNKIYEIGGATYSDKELCLVDDNHHYPRTMAVGSLDAIADLIRAEYGEIGAVEYLPFPPLFIQVESPTKVRVFSRTDDLERRQFPYEATCNDVSFREGWRDQQAAIIELRSRFIPTDDSSYLLDLISRINNDEGVKSEDNGVSQTVTAKKGVSLMATEKVKPRLSLQPFRTFREVAQPESEFILRLDEDGRVGLFEADGGIWKIEAKLNISNYLKNALAEEVETGKVVVMI